MLSPIAVAPPSSQSDLPAPSQVHTYYFEVEILNKGNKGYIAVGYSNKHFKPTSHVGWYQGSYGKMGAGADWAAFSTSRTKLMTIALACTCAFALVCSLFCLLSWVNCR